MVHDIIIASLIAAAYHQEIVRKRQSVFVSKTYPMIKGPLLGKVQYVAKYLLASVQFEFAVNCNSPKTHDSFRSRMTLMLLRR